MKLRTHYAMLALDGLGWSLSIIVALFSFLLNGGDVGLFDATNSNVERRDYIASRCSSLGFHVLYLESICDDPDLVRKNCLSKLQNPDYKDRSPDEALADFYMRLENYKQSYEPLDKSRDKQSSYIRLFNVGEYIVANRCNGVLESDVVSYLLNTHIVPRKIWLCVNGETDFTLKGILGGDPPLNQKGVLFSRKLYEFIHSQGVCLLHRPVE